MRCMQCGCDIYDFGISVDDDLLCEDCGKDRMEDMWHDLPLEDKASAIGGEIVDAERER